MAKIVAAGCSTATTLDAFSVAADSVDAAVTDVVPAAAVEETTVNTTETPEGESHVGSEKKTTSRDADADADVASGRNEDVNESDDSTSTSTSTSAVAMEVVGAVYAAMEGAVDNAIENAAHGAEYLMSNFTISTTSSSSSDDVAVPGVDNVAAPEEHANHEPSDNEVKAEIVPGAAVADNSPEEKPSEGLNQI